MSKGQLFFSMYAAGLVGMAMHFLKLKVKGQSFEDVKQYFVANAKSTITAVLSTAVGVAGLWVTSDPVVPWPSIIAAVPIGFSFDSIFTSGVRSHG